MLDIYSVCGLFFYGLKVKTKVSKFKEKVLGLIANNLLKIKNLS
jgi:hypothetical protein